MTSRRPRLPSAPISLQILALLFGGLIVAQLVTLVLTLLLPPAPPQRHSLNDIAQALRGGALDGESHRPFTRSLETAPPSLNSAGWVVSPRATSDLAKLLAVSQTEVRILFYAPPPLAGTAPAPPRGLPPPGAKSAALEVKPKLILAGYVLAQAGPPPGGGGMPPGGPGPGGMGSPPGGWSGPMGGDPTDRQQEMRRPPDYGGPRRPDSGARRPGPQGVRDPSMSGSRPPPSSPDGASGPGRPAEPPRQRPRSSLEAAVFDPSRLDIPRPAPSPVEAPAARNAPGEAPRATPVPPPVTASPPIVREAPAANVALGGARPPALSKAAPPAPAPIAERTLAAPTAPLAFGLGRARYVEGEFVAALRTPAGWVTVKPQPEGFPNSWQRRVLLWFALSFALVAPIGYLFTRRITAPLRRFAEAAELLGREPGADLAPLAGPAEVGRAARAFNLMQQRLKRYVEDRTGMVGAISHDLRTPLARMRFKLERAPPALRAGLSRDIAQMEEMITSVLSFMRDASAGAQRDTVDLRSILECVVDDAGGGAELAPGAAAPVKVDVLGVQRVFENLVDNALKYGAAAKVSLRTEGAETVVEIADDGPGLSAEDLEQVFKPFYRSQDAKASGKAGMGLGLSVSRATVRAHGGDLVLRPAAQGLVAEVRLPAATSLSIAA